MKSSVATCERRDPKGHYRRARAGQIKDFTGVDAPYEAPERPAIAIDTETKDIDACVNELLDFVVEGQTMTGYFKSQEGEWESNGQVLWVMGRYCRLFAAKPKPEWVVAVGKAVRWVARKRAETIPPTSTVT